MALATDPALELQAINTIRGLSMDAVQKANSGHPGLPMGAAPMAFVLWTEFLKHNPRDPQWPDRDRFVLSAGHGSMLLYSLLHLTGYDLPIEELQRFRQLGSKTPGHPERGETPGVEVTTGPLGQGFANGVGLAIAEQFLAARYNRPGHEIINHHTYGIVSDGDIMEGVALEAASIAGHFGLGKLIYLYDQNHITLAGSAGLVFSEDVPARFEAQGWHTLSIDGMDANEVRAALATAREVTNRPSLICARTIIGYGAPNKQNTFGVHGSPLGPDEVLAAKESLGIPTEPAFYIPDDVATFFLSAIDAGASAQQDWQKRFDAYAKAHPAEAAELKTALSGELPEGWDADLPSWKPGDKAVATRKASGETISAFFPRIPWFIGGSADLDPSTNTGMKGAGDFASITTDGNDEQGVLGGPWGPSGRNIHWGIREHAMASACNGMAAHGGVLPFASTFLVFSDYCRPAIRLAALSHLKNIFVFTHDSIAVGEDGPTHEPVEHVMALRAIPNLIVLRPADANETSEAWKVALSGDRAAALILSRQDLPILDRSEAAGDVSNGGYILAGGRNDPDVVLIATGSEVSLAVGARERLAEYGVNARVVSLPSWELFEAQDATYRESVLGPQGTIRVTVEAGTTLGWAKYTGDNGHMVGIDRFGASGPGMEVLKHFGFTVEHVAAVALRALGNDQAADDLEPANGGDTAGQEVEGPEGHS